MRWQPEHVENARSPRSRRHPGQPADTGRHTLHSNLGVTCFFSAPQASHPDWLPQSQPFPPPTTRPRFQALRLGPRLPLLAHNGDASTGGHAASRGTRRASRGRQERGAAVQETTQEQVRCRKEHKKVRTKGGLCSANQSGKGRSSPGGVKREAVQRLSDGPWSSECGAERPGCSSTTSPHYVCFHAF